LEFGDIGFCGGRKTGEPGEKPSEQGENQIYVNTCKQTVLKNVNLELLL